MQLFQLFIQFYSYFSHTFIFSISFIFFLWCKIHAQHSCRARDPRKASFIDLTAHHVVRSRVRSLSRSAARAHVRETIHLTGDPISRAVAPWAQHSRRKSPVRFCARHEWAKHMIHYDQITRISVIATQAALFLLEWNIKNKDEKKRTDF